MLTQLTAGNILPHRIICHNYPIQMSLFSGRSDDPRCCLRERRAGRGSGRVSGGEAARRRSGGRKGSDTLISRPLTCTRCITLSPRESNVEMSYGPATGLVEYLPASDYLHSDLPLRVARRCQACSPRRLAAGRVLNPFHRHSKA